jgi:hypothetical protein
VAQEKKEAAKVGEPQISREEYEGLVRNQIIQFVSDWNRQYLKHPKGLKDTFPVEKFVSAMQRKFEFRLRAGKTVAEYTLGGEKMDIGKYNGILQARLYETSKTWLAESLSHLRGIQDLYPYQEICSLLMKRFDVRIIENE